MFQNKLQASLLLTAVTVSVLGLWLWRQRKKTRSYITVGKVKQLFFFPIKSLKAVEVKYVKCTSIGIEVNGFIDRSYMLVTDDGAVISQRHEPSLVLLTPTVFEKHIFITGPDMEPLKIEIKKGISPQDKIIICKLHADCIKAVDCGDEIAYWFQKYLKRSDVHLVRYATELPKREHCQDIEFFKKARKKYPIPFQNVAPFHMLTKSSIDELNSKLEDTKVSVLNFRPNIFIEDYADVNEDHWKYIKFTSGAEIFNLLPCGRCVTTTNNPDTGIKTDNEPLITLRKYRIAKDPEMKKLTKHSPCLGLRCVLENPGDINIGDDVFAVIEKDMIRY